MGSGIAKKEHPCWKYKKIDWKRVDKERGGHKNFENIWRQYLWMSPLSILGNYVRDKFLHWLFTLSHRCGWTWNFQHWMLSHWFVFSIIVVLHSFILKALNCNHEQCRDVRHEMQCSLIPPKQWTQPISKMPHTLCMFNVCNLVLPIGIRLPSV